MAHACDGAHRAHDVGVLSLEVAPGVHTAQAHSAGHSHDANQPADVDGEQGTASHNCCAGLQCHVGTAILPCAPLTIGSLPQAEPFAAPEPDCVSSTLSPLDRPPRATVQI